MALVTMKGVTVAFDGVTVIDRASLTIGRGDYLVILGENGSGKSTLMRTLLGLVKPRSGSVVYGDGLARTRIGYLPQQTDVQRSFPASVCEVVLSGRTGRLGRRLWPGRAERREADAKMKLLGISALAQKAYRTLSGGQQQRVLLARALLATDSLLLLDEPVTGLDPEASEEMYRVIRRLNRDEGVAIVMISHDVRSAVRDAKHVLVMDRGVDYYGSAEDFRAARREA